MNELLESFRAQVNERLNSPLFGAYFISWLLFNYKILVVLFADMAVADKFAFIDTRLYADGAAVAKSFLVPAIVSALYVFVLPYPARLALRFTLYQNRINKEHQQKIEGQILLTKDEAESLKAIANEKISKLEDLLEKKERQITRIKEELQSYQKQNEQLDNERAEYARKIKDERDVSESIRSELQLLKSRHASLIDSHDALRHEIGSIKNMNASKYIGSSTLRGFAGGHSNNADVNLGEDSFSVRNGDVRISVDHRPTPAQSHLPEASRVPDSKLNENLRQANDLLRNKKSRKS